MINKFNKIPKMPKLPKGIKNLIRKKASADNGDDIVKEPEDNTKNEETKGYDTVNNNQSSEIKETDAAAVKSMPTEVSKVDKNIVVADKNVQSGLEIEKEPTNSEFTIDVSSSKMTATLVVSEPLNGGTYIEVEDVKQALISMNITYGIDEQLLESTILGKTVGSVDIAIGTNPINGENGKIIDKFDRVKTKKPLEKANGTIDFKSLDLIDIVEEGSVISELVPHTTGSPGFNIFGKEIQPKSGKPAKLNSGKNTYITDDELFLMSKISGNVYYKGNVFNIEDILNIKSDVDNSTGNIYFNGNVIINGDVLEGFTVKADGDILIKGSIIGGSIYGKKNIIIEKGINGSFRAVLQAEGDITSRFIENTNVVSKGDIFAECILNSTIVCNGHIDVTSGKGVIIGGEVSSYKGINCKVLGSSGGAYTNVSIGITLELTKKKKSLSLELKQLKEQNIQIEQNITYITSKVSKDNVPEPVKELLLKLKKEKPVNLLMQRHIQKQLSELYEEFFSNKKSTITADIAYYQTNITIAETSYFCDEDYVNVSAYVDDDGNPMILRTLKMI